MFGPSQMRMYFLSSVTEGTYHPVDRLYASVLAIEMDNLSYFLHHNRFIGHRLRLFCKKQLS